MSVKAQANGTILSEMRRKLENLGYDCSIDYDAALAEFREDHKTEEKKEWQPLSEQGGYTFAEVLKYELKLLDGDKSPDYEPADPVSIYKHAHDAKLSGLAFSGGGIRSATFNLGVIQGLAEINLLSHFDYLSTVSGGGYIGGWLSKWISERGGDINQVQSELAGKNADPHLPRMHPWPVQFLRRYSNYLTPRKGMFSADTWTLICIYCRNTSLNMIMLFAWLALLFMVPRFVLYMVPQNHSIAQQWGWICAAIVSFLIVVFFIAMSISRKGKLPWHGWASQSQSAILICICIPLIVSGFTGAIVVWGHRQSLANYWDCLPSSLIHQSSFWLLVPGLLYIAIWGAGWATAQYLNKKTFQASVPPTHATSTDRRSKPNGIKEQIVGHFASAVTALTIGTIILLKGVSLLVGAEGTSISERLCNAPVPESAAQILGQIGLIKTVQLATFGMPLMLLLFGVTVTLMIGLIGRLYRDQSREWWARQSAWTVICAICWLIIFCSTFYIPPLLNYAWDHAGGITSIGASLAALTTAVGLKSGSGKSTGTLGAVKSKEFIAQIAPYAFMLLTIGGLTTVLHWQVSPPSIPSKGFDTVSEYIAAYEASSGNVARVLIPSATDMGIGIITLAVGLLITALVLGWRVDVNKFSLYMMYRLRLVRAYFGASTKGRAPHPFTGFDPRDDRKLSDLLKQKNDLVQRPLHLINTAVNMVGGKELAWQTRKAGNFCFSPAFSGFELPQMSTDDKRSHSPRGAYRPTAHYATKTAIFKDDDAGIHLGTAIAVSGAAASPNMGYHSSPPLTFLMTLFNLRLGRWSPNPVKKDVWQHAAPRIGIFSTLSELFGMTDTNANFLYLSDGGHFENLGLYELVRRRCRLIVVVDASADSNYEFGDLGNAIRKCQTDFNVSISLKTSDIKTLGSPPPKPVSFVTGTINYAQADGPAAADGVLLYIKPIVVGDENADIVNYSKIHPGFPHQSTADQWFDEDQFESYRVLGRSAALSALEKVSIELQTDYDDTLEDLKRRRSNTDQICKRLKMRANLPEDHLASSERSMGLNEEKRCASMTDKVVPNRPINRLRRFISKIVG